MQNRKHWHHFTAEEALLQLDTTVARGLTANDVETRLKQYGENTLPERQPPSLFSVILNQFKSPLIYVLLAAAALALVMGEFTDAAFIALVLSLNAIIGTVQEWNAERSALALHKLLKIVARVTRDHHDQVIVARNLVPGDIVRVESGDRVPADLRLIEAHNLTIDEAFLTGENIPPAKTTPPVAADTSLADWRNIAFAGSQVMSGRGLGVVVATGASTQVGQIAASVAFEPATKPPLIIRMERFAQVISIVVVAAVLALGGIGLARGMPLTEIFFIAVALAVSAIPEGLPIAMTVALSIAVNRMAKRNVIVRKLAAVEGLGSCTCIASDKTGTLTVNIQTVKALWLTNGSEYTIDGEGLDISGTIRPAATAPHTTNTTTTTTAPLDRLIRAGALCNEAVIDDDPDAPPKTTLEARGDAMDIALAVLARKHNLHPTKLHASHPIVASIPYESENKFAAAFFREPSPNAPLAVAIKGALETVLGFCDHALRGDSLAPLDANLRRTIEQRAEAFAEAGYRVLAIADGTTPNDPGTDPKPTDLPRLTFLGLAAFLDPLRPDAKPAVEKCRTAGIRVVMVTGDHPATALSIAKELGIATSRDDVVTGAELTELSPRRDAFNARVARSSVFARVSPLQKLEIVSALADSGHFVAVTGDGVNDAPALKKASIGIAMGSGTDVAKDTADIVITDDKFASIAAGVEEGRYAYDNVRKVTYLLISCGFAEVLMFAATLVAGLPLPLNAVQLLWLNLVTNGIQDVALAFEGGEPGAMRKPPRKPDERMFNPLMIQQVFISGTVMASLAFGAFWFFLETGMSEFSARNHVLLLFVLCENVHVFNTRSETTSAFRVPLSRNYLLLVGAAAAQILHIGSMHVPLMQRVLSLEPVPFLSWVELVTASILLLIVMEAFKAYRAHRTRDISHTPHIATSGQ